MRKIAHKFAHHVKFNHLAKILQEAGRSRILLRNFGEKIEGPVLVDDGFCVGELADGVAVLVVDDVVDFLGKRHGTD